VFFIKPKTCQPLRISSVNLLSVCIVIIFLLQALPFMKRDQEMQRTGQMFIESACNFDKAVDCRIPHNGLDRSQTPGRDSGSRQMHL
jgi:hypothetical protein